MEPIINLSKVCYDYINNRPALTDISMEVGRGEIYTVVGSNGSGKSTLLHILSGLIFPKDGKFIFNGYEVNETKLKSAEFNRYFRAHIGYVFQNPDVQLFCPTVLDELLFAPQQLGVSDEEAQVRAQSVMEMLHIDCLADRPTYMLSGGEKKRVAIGAVLTSNPEVLIIDEPVSGLDPKTRSFLIELIFNLNQAGKTVIIATHHLELVNHFQARVMVLSEKHMVEKVGSCDEILSDTELLLRTNLIGEYPHRHDGQIHKHLSTGFLFHNHNNHHKH